MECQHPISEITADVLMNGSVTMSVNYRCSCGATGLSLKGLEMSSLGPEFEGGTLTISSHQADEIVKILVDNL